MEGAIRGGTKLFKMKVHVHVHVSADLHACTFICIVHVQVTYVSTHTLQKEAATKFHVLLTSYEFISVDATILQSINWEVKYILILIPSQKIFTSYGVIFNTIHNF